MCQAQVSLKILGPLTQSWKNSRSSCLANTHTHAHAHIYTRTHKGIIPSQPPSMGWLALGNTLLTTGSVIAEVRNGRTLATVT